MRIFYLSTTAFADNQISLLHHFSKNYSIIYGSIIPCKNSNFTESELSRYCLQHNIPFKSYKLKYRFRDPRLIFTYFRIVREIKQADPDIIFIPNFDQIYLNLLLLLLDRRKTIIAMHDVVNHSKTAFDRLTTLGKKILFYHFNTFLTYSRGQAGILKATYPKKTVYTIPLPLIGFGDLPAIDGDKKEITFLFFGNILHYKGLDILLKSINRLSQRFSNFKLIIAGRCNNWEQEYLPLILNNHAISAHIGFIHNDQVPNFFAQADYLILPYRDTTQSGPLMIAYNYNIPVIASNAEGFDEFFEEGITGFRFNINDPKNIDNVLSDAIERSHLEYGHLKQKLARYVEQNFDCKRLVKSFETMFDATAAPNHRGIPQNSLRIGAHFRGSK